MAPRRPSAAMLVVGALALGCGAPPAGDVAALRLQLGDRPRDPAVHLALAAALGHEGRPGGSVRHFELAARGGALPPWARRALAGLLIGRARARLTVDDPGAESDLVRARELDPSAAIARRLWVDAAIGTAIAALRRAGRVGARDAAAALARAAAVAPRDPRLAIAAPGRAPLGDLAVAIELLDVRGARLAALGAAETYVERGGRDAATLARLRVLHRWWYGGDTSLPLAARPPADARARELLAAVAEPDRAVEALAEAGWRGRRTAAPDEAGAWVAVALAVYLAGESPGWLAALEPRVDLAALAAAPAALPIFAAATLLRAAGDASGSRRALVVATAQLAALTVDQRAVVAAEAAIAGDRGAAAALSDAPSGMARLVAIRFGGAPADGLRGPWTPRQPAAVPGSLPPAARSRAAARRERLRDGFGLPRAAGRGAAATDALPLGVVDPARLVAPELAAGLVAVARAWRIDPALSDRVAGDYLDGAVLATPRALAVADLMLRLGDPARAARFAARAQDESPETARTHEVAARCEVARRDVPRAELFYTEAAARSGDGGRTLLGAARELAAAGEPLAAVAAARRALQLTAPDATAELHAIVAAAERALDRRPAIPKPSPTPKPTPSPTPASTATPTPTPDRVPSRPPAATGPSLDDLVARDPSDVELAAQLARIAPGRGGEALARALDWSPLAVAPRLELLAVGDEATAQVALAELIDIAALGPPRLAARALVGLARHAEASGRGAALAAALRREARALR